MNASQTGHVEVLRLLLEAGADKFLQNNDGFSALRIASDKSHKDAHRLLQEFGADET